MSKFSIKRLTLIQLSPTLKTLLTLHDSLRIFDSPKQEVTDIFQIITSKFIEQFKKFSYYFTRNFLFLNLIKLSCRLKAPKYRQKEFCFPYLLIRSLGGLQILATLLEHKEHVINYFRNIFEKNAHKNAAVGRKYSEIRADVIFHHSFTNITDIFS